ncbi:hypothetical protein NA8A_04683 [Nitratireductor indicus C115]|uniref:Uncharacterized protein n=1 Tax=Nitratireductor indicus C115 TaxID=1231190 RepID=K2N742_9HYPH|nr:hypothetical protein [Nitratireductor indicus]EKF43298.1 hypothetical protein NA8A_04683 [Nitratireductor indicus C115]SFQ10684.1 hypothetical protein SAMN05216176_101373 [Nitratireductor indicus]
MKDQHSELPSLHITEDAVETIGGLVTMLSYVHSVSSAEDRESLHNPIGYTLNAVQCQVNRARRGYEGSYASRWKRRAEQG